MGICTKTPVQANVWTGEVITIANRVQYFFSHHSLPVTQVTSPIRAFNKKGEK